MYSKILVPLDGSTVAEQVLPYARFVSDKMALSIELVSVLDLDQIAAQLPSKDARFFDKAVGESTRQSSAYLESVAPT